MVIAKKAAMILAAAMLLCALICGCGGGSELRHVTLNEVTRSVFYAPLYCAASLGYFEKEGLDVEIVTSGGSDKSMTALIRRGRGRPYGARNRHIRRQSGP